MLERWRRSHETGCPMLCGEVFRAPAWVGCTTYESQISTKERRIDGVIPSEPKPVANVERAPLGDMQLAVFPQLNA